MLEHPPEKIINALSAVDLIIHAADFTDVKTLLPVKEIIEVENTLIGTTMDQAVLGE